MWRTEFADREQRREVTSPVATERPYLVFCTLLGKLCVLICTVSERDCKELIKINNNY